MDMNLPIEIERLIAEQVRSGRYSSANEVVAAAVVALDQQHRQAASESVLQGLRNDIAVGIAAAEACKFVDGETFFDELERKDATALRDRKTA